MKKYKVKTKIVFEGEFIVTAEDKTEAEENVLEHCGMVGGYIHSTLPDEEVDWGFPIHPDVEILKITKVKRNGKKVM